MARSKRLLRYLQPYAPHFAGSFAASTGASVLDGMSFALLIPFLRVLFGATPLPTSDGSAIDGILETLFGRVLQPEDPVAALQASVILIFLVVLFKNLMGYIAAYLAAYLEEGVARDLRLALYSHVIRLPLSTLERRKGGDLVTRMLADADQAKGFISHTLASVLRNAILISVYLVILFALSWELTLATLVIGPVIALLVAPLTSRMRRQLKTALDSRGELTARMVEALSGARLVKAYRGESYEEERFARAAQGYFKGIVRTQRYAVAASPLSESLGAAAVVILMLTASWVAAGDSAFMRPELFVTFVAVTIRLLPPIKSLSQFPAYAELALSAAQRVFDVLDEDREPESVGRVEFRGVERSIVFDDVWFRYQDDWVLRGISFEVPVGCVIGLVGPSGGGKSTIVDLIPNFIKAAKGAVAIDGIDVRQLDRRSLRENIGIVSQETVIFNDSVITNIAYGDDRPRPERVEWAARAANADGFIRELPEGYRTSLGERGARLSGGERQRIALARAIYRDPPILILDEATSALDPESERLVHEAFERLFADRTVIVIAHRLSTVANADKIVVVDAGSVKEIGTHEQLLAAGGTYAGIYAAAGLTGPVQ